MTVIVSTTEDAIIEPTESFQEQLKATESGVTLGLSDATATITDDD